MRLSRSITHITVDCGIPALLAVATLQKLVASNAARACASSSAIPSASSSLDVVQRYRVARTRCVRRWVAIRRRGQ
jgi:hypothetical protein